MRIRCLTSLDELAPYADDWNWLAGGVPLRGWEWLSAWWRHYGGCAGETPRTRLFVPCIFDDNEVLIGLAPWYLDTSAAHGRVLRMLGTGEVASDYLTILCRPGSEDAVADALADEMDRQAMSDDSQSLRWDLLELEGIDAEDGGVARLAGRFGDLGHTVCRRPGMNCWRLTLPTAYDDYLAALPKNPRRQFRTREQKYLDSGRAVMTMVERHEELPAALDAMIAMHQRRRHALGETGCFDSSRFTAFLREVSVSLHRAGRLQLSRIDVDGNTAGFQYALAGGGILYIYQGAIDPDALECSPGKLLHVGTVRRAIAQGYRGIDFLRGDEPYKAYFGCQPRASDVWRVVPQRAAARLRHNIWLAKTNVRQWVKRGLTLVKTRTK